MENENNINSLQNNLDLNIDITRMTLGQKKFYSYGDNVLIQFLW